MGGNLVASATAFSVADDDFLDLEVLGDLLGNARGG